MASITIEQELTLWMVNDVPARMVYAGRRWKITDTPTRLRDSVWSVPLEHRRGLYGWRFQATDAEEHTFIFDVYRAEDHWHVHRTYS